MSNVSKYHVSKNLSKSIKVGTGLSRYSNILLIDADIEPDTTYTLSFDANAGYSLYTNENIFTRSAVIDTNDSRNTITATTKSTLDKSSSAQYSGGKWIFLKANQVMPESAVITNVMLNTGSTALPYEPYSTAVWHDLAPKQYINGEFTDNADIPEKYQGGLWG